MKSLPMKRLEPRISGFGCDHSAKSAAATKSWSNASIVSFCYLSGRIARWVAYLLLNQWTRVRFLKLPRFFSLNRFLDVMVLMIFFDEQSTALNVNSADKLLCKANPSSAYWWQASTTPDGFTQMSFLWITLLRNCPLDLAQPYLP
jgi:hypothetical protein